MTSLAPSELARLLRFLTAHQNRFALAFVRIPQFPLRKELAQSVEEFAREQNRPFRRFDFTGLRPLEIWDRIERGTESGTIAMLDGADSALNDPEGKLASILNGQRERLAEFFPGPVLLLLGDTAMTHLLTDAPDFADWHAATFEFEGAAAPVPREEPEHAIPEMSSELIDSRINLLEKQLREQMPDRTRARVLIELARLHRDSVFGVPAGPSRRRTRNVLSSMHAAEAALCEAVDLLRRRAGGDPSAELQLDLGRALNEFGLLYVNAGRFGEAEPLLSESLRISERVLGPEHPGTLTSVNNLAYLYESQGRYGDAEPLYQRALAARERVLGPEHPGTLTSVNNLANLYARQGRYGDAEPLYQRALAARERVLGPEHPDTLTSVNNLAYLYESQGRYGDAEPLYQRALAASERVLGPEHPGTLTSVNNLAALYASQGRYGDAEPLYQRALAAHERVLGPEHPSTLTSVNNLAVLYESQGRYEEAEPLFRRALAGMERVWGTDHPDTKAVRANLEGARASGAKVRQA